MAEVSKVPAPAGLRGSRCGDCAVTVYPADDACPRCGRATSPVALSAVGTLWTWTVQRFAPKSPPFVPPPEGFRPFALGYVELPEGVRVAAVLDTDDLGSIQIGMPLRIEPSNGVPHAIPIEEA
ncbi:Zn-ribbon domain-containing OB-fold protein [Sphaerisporangium perillae]|uniref:Zn-ribbon domain-containing OB-fold protein n=1 Tax=Sphaerisporangium perillae TaxID=2935860 RepID=UPI00200FDD87|nr:OB-fold domain-containing protein [Sphaerisporangium perillae]